MNFNNSKTSLRRILLPVFFLTLSLGQFQRIQLTPQIAIYIHEILLFSCYLIFFPLLKAEYAHLFRFIKKKPSLQFLLFFFFLQTIVYQILEPQIVSILYLVRLLLYGQILLLVRSSIKHKLFTKNQFLSLIVGMSGIIAIVGLAQYVFIPDTRWLVVMGWDDHYYRLISTLFDPGFTGLIISIGLITFFYQFFRRITPVSIFISIVFLIALLLTYSRASYLAWLVAMGVLFFYTRKKTLILFVMLFCILIPFLPRPSSEGVKLERTASITSRLNSNQQALKSLSLNEVILGRGFYRDISGNVTSLPNHATAPDNSFVFIFTSLGIIGCLLLVWITYELHKFLNYPLFICIFSTIAIHSLFNNSLFYIWTMVILATMIGITSLRHSREWGE